VQSILLYGAPTWAPTLAYNPRGVETLARVLRPAAIRSAYAYRTVFYDAVQVVTWTPPIDLLAVEHVFAYDARRAMPLAADGRPPGTPITSGLSRATTIDKWARRISRLDAPAGCVWELTQTLISPSFVEQ